MFINAGLNAVLMLLGREQYLVSNAINVETADSHKLVKASGGNTVTTASDLGNFVLKRSQKSPAVHAPHMDWHSSPTCVKSRQPLAKHLFTQYVRVFNQ